MKSPLVSIGNTASEELQRINYENGKKDMKEQMMKDAVDAEVWNYASNEDLRAIPIWGINKFRHLKDGDRVRIIIV